MFNVWSMRNTIILHHHDPENDFWPMGHYLSINKLITYFWTPSTNTPQLRNQSAKPPFFTTPISSIL